MPISRPTPDSCHQPRILAVRSGKVDFSASPPAPPAVSEEIRTSGDSKSVSRAQIRSSGMTYSDNKPAEPSGNWSTTPKDVCSAIDFCSSRSKVRIDSTWSPNHSSRNGLGWSQPKMSRMPPRTAYWPRFSTRGTRSNPASRNFPATSSSDALSPTLRRKSASRSTAAGGTSSDHCDFRITAATGAADGCASCARVASLSAFNSGSGSAPGMGASSSRGRKSALTPHACRPAWMRSCARRSSQITQSRLAPSSRWSSARRNGCAASPTPEKSTGDAIGRARARNAARRAATLGASATRRKSRSLPSPFAEFACKTFSAAPSGAAGSAAFIECAIAG